MADNVLPALYNKVRAHLHSLLPEVPAISLTTDIWSSDVSPMALLSLTVHWIDCNFEMKAAVLHANQFRESHTAKHIQLAIEDMLNKWETDKKQVHVVLRDNARNMNRVMNDLGVPSVGCLAHSLNLVVHEGVLSQCNITDALANARKIVDHSKHSPQAYARLENIQVAMNIPVKCLQQDVQTR